MDSFGILTLITFALVFAALVVHFYYRKKNRSEAEINLLNEYAREHDGAISMHDIWDRIHIGMDNQATNKLFFIRTTPGHEAREVLDLATVRNCKLDKRVKTYSKNRDKVEVLEKIDLVFTFAEAGKAPIRLEFYNNDYDALTLSRELQLALKWEEIVKQAIDGTRKNRPADAATEEVRRTA